MFTKLAKHRKFDYTPRVYNPNKETGSRQRIHFTQLRTRKKSHSFIWMLILAGFIVYLLFMLSNVANNF